MVNQLKGVSTSEMMRAGNHPLKSAANPGERPPRMWSAHEWKVFLDNDDSIREAIAYVERNPENEGKPKQTWSFVSPFAVKRWCAAVLRRLPEHVDLADSMHYEAVHQFRREMFLDFGPRLAGSP